MTIILKLPTAQTTNGDRFTRQLVAAFLTLTVATTGCAPRDEVRMLEVPKEPRFQMPDTMPEVREAAGGAAQLEARMLAAIVPREERVWFFKMVGNPDEVRAQRGEFRQLMESLSFDGDGEPSWALPESWSEQPGSGMRKATLKVGDGARAPSVSVIGLAAPQDVLSNVNRWRGQLQLDEIDASELAELAETFEVNDAQVTLVDLAGSVDPHATTIGAPVIAGAPSPRDTANGAAPDSPVSELAYEPPPEWTETAAGGMRKAAFTVADGEAQAEVTVISLPPAAGEVLPNVNRWRGQLGLEPLDESSLAAAIREITIDEAEANYIPRMAENPGGQGKATIAAMISRGGSVWFFKLTGDDELVQREEANFEKFLESVKFPSIR